MATDKCWVSRSVGIAIIKKSPPLHGCGYRKRNCELDATIRGIRDRHSASMRGGQRRAYTRPTNRIGHGEQPATTHVCTRANDTIAQHQQDSLADPELPQDPQRKGGAEPTPPKTTIGSEAVPAATACWTRPEKDKSMADAVVIILRSGKNAGCNQRASKNCLRRTKLEAATILI